jgi:acyl-CoA thioesterase FadM
VRLDDLVDLRLVAERVGRSSLDLRMDGHVGERHVVVVRTRNVWTTTSESGRRSSAPLPDWLRSAAAVSAEP